MEDVHDISCRIAGDAKDSLGRPPRSKSVSSDAKDSSGSPPRPEPATKAYERAKISVESNPWSLLELESARASAVVSNENSWSGYENPKRSLKRRRGAPKAITDIDLPDDLRGYFAVLAQNYHTYEDLVVMMEHAACASGERQVAEELAELRVRTNIQQTKYMMRDLNPLEDLFVPAAALFDVSEISVRSWLHSIRVVDCGELELNHKLPSGVICEHTQVKLLDALKDYRWKQTAQHLEAVKEVLPEDLLAPGGPLIPARSSREVKEMNEDKHLFCIGADERYPATKREIFFEWIKQGWSCKACHEYWEVLKPKKFEGGTLAGISCATPTRKRRVDECANYVYK